MRFKKSLDINGVVILDYGKPMSMDDVVNTLNEIADLEESNQDVFSDEEHYNASKLRLKDKIGKYRQHNDPMSDNPVNNKDNGANE